MIEKTTLVAVLLLCLAAAGCTRQQVSQRQAPANTGAEQQESESAPTVVLPTVTPVPSPQPTDSPEPPPAPVPTGAAQTALDLNSSDMAAAIYAAAIRHVYDKNFSSGGEAEFPLVYLIAETDDGQTLGAPPTAPQKVPGQLQQSVQAALAGEPYEIIWAPRVAEVPQDSKGQIAEGEGIYMILGNVLAQGDGTMHLPLIMVCGPLCLSGTIYVLEQVDGDWQVTGTTGLEVMG